MRYDLKVINNMVCETFNGKIINENTFDVINNNESCFIHKSNDKNKADIIIKLIKVFEDLSKGECIVLKYIIESKIKLYEEYNKLSYSFDANSDFYIDIKQSTGYGYINAKDSLNSLYKKNIIIKQFIPDSDNLFKNRYSLNSQYCPENIITNKCKAIIINL